MKKKTLITYTDAFAEFMGKGQVSDSHIFRDLSPHPSPRETPPLYRYFAVSLSMDAHIRVLKPKVGVNRGNIPT